jgi:hypothetical protein
MRWSRLDFGTPDPDVPEGRWWVLRLSWCEIPARATAPFYDVKHVSQGILRSPGPGALARALLAATAAGGTMRGPASGQPPWCVFDVAPPTR